VNSEKVCVAAFLFLAGWQISAQAAVIHNELIPADFPDLNTSAVIVEVSVGSNEIVGEVGTYPETLDTFVLDLRPGLRLDAITLHELGPHNGGQIGINVMYQDTNSHYSMSLADVGANILPLLELTWGPGYSSPIQNGVVEIALLNTLNRNFFRLDFHVSQVSIPPALWLFGSAVLGLIATARNRTA
jgi:hypothetical protein